MQWRRFLAVASVVLSIGAAGCGGDDSPNRAATKTADDAIKVGLVTDIGQLNDRGFNHLAYLGLKQAQRRLGIEGRVIQSATAADYIPNLSSLARKGYDLVIGVGYAQGEAIAAAAVKYPKTRFAIIDVDQATLPHKPNNVVGLLFKEQEAGYLAGALAALSEKRRAGRDVISAVGGMKEPPVDRFIAGYQAGAEKAVPGITVLNGYSRDWDDQAKCKELALDQIERGAGVVFQVAGGCGLGALDAAKQRRVWGVGVDADQSFLGPHVLTSAEKKVDRAVYLTIEDVVKSRWRGGRNAVFGLAQGGVGLGTTSAKAHPSDIAVVKRLESQILGSKIAIPTSVH